MVQDIDFGWRRKTFHWEGWFIACQWVESISPILSNRDCFYGQPFGKYYRKHEPKNNWIYNLVHLQFLTLFSVVPKGWLLLGVYIISSWTILLKKVSISPGLNKSYALCAISFIFIVIGLWLISINHIKKSKNKRRRSLS